MRREREFVIRDDKMGETPKNERMSHTKLINEEKSYFVMILTAEFLKD